MFPYRRRTPVYGGKLKQRKKEEQAQRQDGKGDNKVDPLAAGGPVQCGIGLDLIEQRPRFLNQIGAAHREDPRPACHNARGRVFASFKEIFWGSKLALLHTRVTPPRCDRDMYSQLIYAACLSLLREAFKTEGRSRLEHAAYALFCLYALYETNPLPTAPQDERSILEMLPLGLQSAENAKFLYRRSFKTPIRIDRAHYILLQRLRDEALATQADCLLCRMDARGQQLQESLNGGENSSGDYSCICGVATDTIQILEKLFSTNLFDMAEYTGPCGLEGLAGHEDYPYSSCRPTKKQKRSGQDTNQEPARMTDDELDELGTSRATSTTNDLSTFMESYRSRLECIRPDVVEGTVQQKDRQIRSTLEPLWQQQSIDSTWKTTMPPPPAMRPAASYAAYSTEPVRGGNLTQVAGEEGLSNDNEGGEKAEISTNLRIEVNNEISSCIPFRVTLPNGLPEAVQKGIRQALRALMEREGDALRVSIVAGHKKDLEPPAIVAPPIAGRLPPEPSPSIYSGGDEWSSVGFEGASVNSIATGHGESALRSLLLRASAGKDKTGDRSHANPVLTTPTVPRAPQATTTANARNHFLTLDPHFSEVDKSDEESASSISELSSDDEVSVAASAIGQTALRTLLATVRDNGTSKLAIKRKVPKRNTAKKQSHRVASKPNKSGNKQSSIRKRKIRAAANDGPGDGSSASKSLFSDEDSFISARGSGKAALDALLSRVTNSTGALNASDAETS